jgi:glycosyltransferase involved in cell wall biosynthesis
MSSSRAFGQEQSSVAPTKEISILLPAYNEASRIEKCIREVKRTVGTISGSYEIVVIEDGSTDGTDKIVASLTKTDPHLNFFHSTTRLGKGKAIRTGLRVTKGDIVVFMDVDLATSLTYLPRIVSLAKKYRGLIIGSRHVKGSRVQRSVTRTVSSLTYNLLVRVLFLDGIHDHQCGFKAMSHEITEFLWEEAKSDGFFLDTEMILLCKMHGIPVMEVGIEWVEVRKKKTSGVRLLQDSAKLALDLLRFRLSRKPR